MANSARVVSMVCAMARKCHAGRPKKSRCSTTLVSILAAFTAYFENRTRYSRISPGRNGTAIATGAAGDTAGLAFFLLCLDCCADPKEANASTAASSGAADAKRRNLARVLNNEFARSGEAGSRRSFPACKLRRHDAAQGARSIQSTEKRPRKPVALSLVFRCMPRRLRNSQTLGTVRSVVPNRFFRFEKRWKRTWAWFYTPRMRPAGTDGAWRYSTRDVYCELHYLLPAGIFCFNSSVQFSTTLISPGFCSAFLSIRKRWP